MKITFTIEKKKIFSFIFSVRVKLIKKMVFLHNEITNSSGFFIFLLHINELLARYLKISFQY